MQLSIDGNNAYAYTGGRAHEANRPCVTFIHGAAHDHSVWSLQSRYFAHHGCNVLALDLPGHGRSAGEAPASIEALADWVSAALEAAGVAQTALVGHSMGSLVALELAARLKERVTALALIGSSVPMGVSDGLLKAAREDTPAAIRMITQWSHAPASLLGGNHSPGLWLPGINSALMRRAKPGVLYRDLLNCRQYERGLDAAATVSCPTLLICGKRDQMTPAKAIQGLRESVRGIDVVAIDGAGHALMVEQPDAVLDALRGLLRK